MSLSSLFALTYLAVLAVTSPAQPALVPRACTTQLPISYQQISENQPSTPFTQGRLFKVSQANNGVSDVDTLVRFAGIPSGSYGCQLSVSFTYEYQINSTGNALLNVYSLPNDISSTDTYTTYFGENTRGTPKGSYLFDTIQITGQKAVLNSQTCKPALGYLFEIASDTAAGSVSFLDAGDNLSGIGGLYMTYDC